MSGNIFVLTNAETTNTNTEVVALGQSIFVAQNVYVVDEDPTTATTAIYGSSWGTAQIEGSVYGANGLVFAGQVGATTSIQISSAGSVSSFGNLFGAVTVETGVYNINNAGLIDNTDQPANGDGDGLDVDLDYGVADGSGGGRIVNSGSIESSDGYGVLIADTGADTDILINTGLIEGKLYGVYSGASAQEVSNSGAIYGGVELFGEGSVVDNSGQIIGGIQFLGEASSLTDSGRVTGGVAFVGGSVNDGQTDVTIDAGGVVSSAPGGNAVTVSNGQYYIYNAGEIVGTQTTGGSTNAAGIFLDSGTAYGTIVNDGKIEGPFAGVYDNGGSGALLTIDNHGTIAGSASGIYDSAQDTLRIYNTGNIDGQWGESGGGQKIFGAIYVVSTQASIALTNGATGVIDGGIVLDSYAAITNQGSIDFADLGGADTSVVNSGTMGVITFESTATSASLVNSGKIDGQLQADVAISLSNSGLIDSQINLAGGSTVHNSGTIAGGVDLLGGSVSFFNAGHLAGDLIFSGTNNVFNGVGGSVIGTIYGAGANSDYYAGAGAETFDFNASGAGIVKGGSGDDIFIYTVAGFDAGTTILGGSGKTVDTLEFSNAGVIGASAFAHVSSIEAIDLANGTSSLTLTNALVSSAGGASLTVYANGDDTIDLSGVSTKTDRVQIEAGIGPDQIVAGAANDVFVFHSVADSNSTSYDTITAMNFGHDDFNVSPAAGAIKAIQATVKGALSSGAAFDTDLTALLGHGKAHQLGAHDALLFTATSGNLKGDTFLVVDSNGTAGYTAGADLVIRLSGQTGTLTTANFI